MKFSILILAVLGAQAIKINQKCEPCDDEPDHCGCYGGVTTVVHSYPAPVVHTHTTVIPGYTWSSVVPSASDDSAVKKIEEKMDKESAKSAAVDAGHEAAADHAKEAAEKVEETIKAKDTKDQVTKAVDKIQEDVKKNAEASAQKHEAEKIKDEIKKVAEKTEK